MKYDELIKDLRICASTFCESCEKCSHSNKHGDCYNGLKRSAADAIEELQSQLPRWIPVTERLPKAEYGESEDVLTIDSLKVMRVAYFDGGNWCYPTGEVISTTCKFHITHWMPLPEPPKEETDG